MEGGKRRPFILLSLFCLSLLVSPSSGIDGPSQSAGGAPTSGETKRDIASQGGATSRPEWQILTKRNFSSQIRAHRHLLLLVTVPWSGESRSLKKDVVSLVSTLQDETGDLKLMLVHKNSEKLISELLGAVEESTIYYYHHSKRFKYRGRMKARAIISSVLYLMSFQPEEAPLKSLNSKEELHNFLSSTDKAMLLVEFCGWASKLLQQNYSGNSNNTINTGSFNEKGETAVEYFRADVALLPDGKEKLKDVESDKLTCSLDDIKPPWFGASSWGTENSSFSAAQERTSNGVYCSVNEFKKFGLFFTKFMEVARETLVPPERLRFGYISDKSLLSYLDVRSPDAWMLLHWTPGCRNCSKVLLEGDDLRAELMDDNLVIELYADRNGRDFSFPMNRPSIILFIDRSSNSSKVNADSKSALYIFKILAQENQQYGKFTGNHFSFDSTDVPYKNLKVVAKSYSDVTSHLSSKSSMQQIIKLNDQMTVMVINQGEQIFPDERTDDTQDSTAYDLLARLLQKRNPVINVKKSKLNLLAKEAGFQLLSDDFEVNVLESLPSGKENDESYTATRSSVMEKDRQVLEYPTEIVDHSIAHNFGSSDSVYMTNLQYNKAAGSNSKSSSTAIPQQSGQEAQRQQESVEDILVIKDENNSVDDKTRSSVHGATISKEPIDMPYQHIWFAGSYYVSDGDYELLRALTGVSKLPAVVILDPYKERHYVYEEADLTYSSLSTFVDKYLNGSLYSYQVTMPSLVYQRENPQPPFVNLDFNEADAIPRMTLKTFSNMIFASRQCDILVLFSNSWCGFCQRMELVVREVYRSVKGFIGVSKSGYTNKYLPHDQDEPGDVTRHVMPSIFYMDCTLNDCSLQLNQLGKKEVYPALVLFPAEGGPFFFEGEVSVNSVIEFIAKYGTSSQHLNRYKGILWTQRDIEHKDPDVLYNLFSTRSPIAGNENKDAVVSGATSSDNGNLSVDVQESVEAQSQEENVVVGSVISATVALSNAFPFDNSSVLIVSADREVGFHGIILNKQMSWKIFAKLEEVVAPLKQAPLSYGGPLRIPNLPFVSLSQNAIQGYIEVSRGLYYGNPASTGLVIEEIRLGNRSAADLWFFFGFSGWEWNQLFGEIARGDWVLSDRPIEHLEWPES